MTRGVLFSIAALCIAGVGAALIAQYRFDMGPCPWCILQRVIFLLIALLCIAGALLPAATHKAFAGGALLFALLGGAAAIYQHVVAAQQASCNLTLADRIINALGLESLVPALFQVTATCADAAVSVFGVPFEYWSLALFTLLALMALWALTQRRAR
ncbi:disulfide bond formation protein B [Piscinibacter sp.]|jgi:disulfide bond formation protein DsbB|uniref:disulfide bond formation protein B n=1 Tax=Piscinibacter sp. TaxID=1903157 RepID=UPI002F3F04F9